VATVGADHVVYGSDWGAPCTTVATARTNRRNLVESGVFSGDQLAGVSGRALDLFPAAARRLSAQEADRASDHGARPGGT
jgi:hypothetical protein